MDQNKRIIRDARYAQEKRWDQDRRWKAAQEVADRVLPGLQRGVNRLQPEDYTWIVRYLFEGQPKQSAAAHGGGRFAVGDIGVIRDA